jgi:hypothetical protein
MQDNTQMTITERRKHLRLMRGRYLLADRIDRSRLLIEMEAVTGMHRKSLFHLLHAAIWHAGHAPPSAPKPTTPEWTILFG